MKTIIAPVALQLATAHVPNKTVSEDLESKTISGTVDSYAVDPSIQEAPHDANPILKTSSFTCPKVEGQDDEVTIDAYVQANIASITGGTVVTTAEESPNAEVASGAGSLAQ